jgi:hypothetical protein
MANEALDREGQFVKTGQSLPGVLFGSRAFFLAPRISWRWGRWRSRRFLESVLWGTDFSWPLSLPTRGLMWMGYPAPCTILPPMDASLECRALGSRLFFLTLSSSLSWGSHCPNGPICCDCQAGALSPWTSTALSSHPMWGGARFTLSLSGGESPSGWYALL